MTAATQATVVLDRAKMHYSLHTYAHDPRSKSYGDEAAAALGIDPQRIYKTLIASVDGHLVCSVVPVAASLNLKALAAAAGGKRAEMADPAKAQRATGYVLGGISPLGHRSRIPVFVDVSVNTFETVFVSAGKRGVQVELSPADLLSAAGARLAQIAAA